MNIRNCSFKGLVFVTLLMVSSPLAGADVCPGEGYLTDADWDGDGHLDDG